MKKIALLGGNGFFGINFIKEHKNKYSISSFDIIKPQKKYKNVKYFNKFNLIKEDFKILNNYDYVIYLADTNIINKKEYTKKYNKYISNKSIKIINKLREISPPIIYLSSYDKGNINLLHNHNFYHLNRIYSESLFLNTFNKKVNILKIGNILGGKFHPKESFYKKLINKLNNNEKIFFNKVNKKEFINIENIYKCINIIIEDKKEIKQSYLKSISYIKTEEEMYNYYKNKY